MLKQFIILAVFCTNSLAHALDREGLRKKYRTLVSLSANVDQSKTAPYLLRPLKSKIHFSYAKGSIDWHVLPPVEANIHIDRTGILVKDSKGNAQGKVPNGMLKMTGTLLDMLGGEVSSENKQISVDEMENCLTWRPEGTATGGGISSMSFFFDPQQIISQVRIVSGQELTVLIFNDVVANFGGSKP
jgi:hypothetical protein